MRRLKNRHVLAPAGSAVRARPPAPPALGVGTELEDARVLEEEVALLRKEQAEPRQVDLLLVGLDLREVGVDGEVPRQAARDAVLHVEAGLEVADRRRLGRHARAAGEHVRLDAQVVARADALAALRACRRATRGSAS